MHIQNYFASLLLAMSAVPAGAQISVHAPWLRETPPASKVGAGYATIVNQGKSDDRLLGVTTEVADQVEIHSMTMDGNIMRMRPVAGGLAIPAGGKVALKPGGYHLMLIGLKRTLKRGEMVPLTFRFARAGAVTIRVHVEPLGFQPGIGELHHHD